MATTCNESDARNYFWNAFLNSETVEYIDDVETFGSGSRHSKHEFRKAHRFVAATLADGLPQNDFCGVLELLMACRNGSPHPLAEILVRHGKKATETQQWMICYALREVAAWPHAGATEFLKERATSPKWNMRFQAILALYKNFVKTEGAYRLNNKGRERTRYHEFVNPLMSSMTRSQFLLCSLAMASLFYTPSHGIFAKPFATEYAELQEDIERLALPYLKDDTGGSKAKTLKDLIQTHDFVGVCVFLAIDLEETSPFRDTLLIACCEGSIVAASHDQAARHLAMCFILKKAYAHALEIAEQIALRNPDWLKAQVLVAQILGEMPELEDRAKRKISDLRNLYKVDVENEALLAAVEREIASRRASA